MKKNKKLKNIRHIDYVYPNDPHGHLLSFKTDKSKKIGGVDYRFNDTRLWYKICAGLLWGVAWIVFPVWAFLWMRTRVLGRKNFRALKHKPTVIISNHVHILDAPVLAACATRLRKIRLVTLTQNIAMPVTGEIMKMLGCVPLGSDFGGMRKFTKTVDDLILRKKPFLFYPEAALWPYYTGLRPFMTGGFSFAIRNKAAVLPAVYTFRINKRGIKNRLVLNILPAIMPREGECAEELALRVYDAMLEKIREFYSDKQNNKSGREIKIDFYKDTGDEVEVKIENKDADKIGVEN